MPIVYCNCNLTMTLTFDSCLGTLLIIIAVIVQWAPIYDPPPTQSQPYTDRQFCSDPFSSFCPFFLCDSIEGFPPIAARYSTSGWWRPPNRNERCNKDFQVKRSFLAGVELSTRFPPCDWIWLFCRQEENGTGEYGTEAQRQTDNNKERGK